MIFLMAFGKLVQQVKESDIKLQVNAGNWDHFEWLNDI